MPGNKILTLFKTKSKEEKAIEEIRKKKINFVVKSKLKRIYADKVKIIQVFNNIIGNAIKYINVNNEPYIEVGGEMEGDYYKFYIKDNGNIQRER